MHDGFYPKYVAPGYGLSDNKVAKGNFEWKPSQLLIGHMLTG